MFPEFSEGMCYKLYIDRFIYLSGYGVSYSRQA